MTNPADYSRMIGQLDQVHKAYVDMVVTKYASILRALKEEQGVAAEEALAITLKIVEVQEQANAALIIAQMQRGKAAE